MLTISPVSNQRINSVYFGNRNISEVDKLKAEYDNDEDRMLWEKQHRDLEEIIADKEKSIPKPMKTAMKGGAVFAAGVLGGMATGWSAKYILAAFKDMYSSPIVQKITKKFSENISEPLKKGLKKAETYFSKKITAVKNTSTYKNNKAKLNSKLKQFASSDVVTSLKKFGKSVADNKIVKKVTNVIDTFFGFLAEGVVKAYNKIIGIDYKKAAVGTLSVAGGISTGAVEAIDEFKKPEIAEGEE